MDWKCYLIGLLLFIIISNSQNVNAQKCVQLSSRIGDTITYYEAEKYYLFTDFYAKNFQYVTITIIQDSLYVNFAFLDSCRSFSLTPQQLYRYRENVVKIDDYLGQSEMITTDQDSSIQSCVIRPIKATKAAKPISVIDEEDLKSIGLSGYIQNENNLKTLRKEQKKKESMKNHLIYINNEWVEYGSKDALIKIVK